MPIRCVNVSLSQHVSQFARPSVVLDFLDHLRHLSAIYRVG